MWIIPVVGVAREYKIRVFLSFGRISHVEIVGRNGNFTKLCRK